MIDFSKCILKVYYNFQEDQQDMYEFLEDDYDPKITKEERRERRRVKILQQYEAAKTEEETLTNALQKHKAKVVYHYGCYEIRK